MRKPSVKTCDDKFAIREFPLRPQSEISAPQAACNNNVTARPRVVVVSFMLMHVARHVSYEYLMLYNLSVSYKVEQCISPFNKNSYATRLFCYLLRFLYISSATEHSRVHIIYG